MLHPAIIITQLAYSSQDTSSFQCATCGAHFENRFPSTQFAHSILTLASCPLCDNDIPIEKAYEAEYKIPVLPTWYAGRFLYFKVCRRDQLFNSPFYLLWDAWYETHISPGNPKRDMQQGRLYDAEETVGPVTRFSSIDEASQFANNILQQAWFAEYSPLTHVVVRLNWSKKRSSSRKLSKVIELSSNMMDDLTVLHELAHQIMYMIPNAILLREAYHGPLFACLYLDLIQNVMGQGKYEEMICAFKRFRVRWIPGQNLLEHAKGVHQAYFDLIPTPKIITG